MVVLSHLHQRAGLNGVERHTAVSDDNVAKVLQVLGRQTRQTFSLISFSRNAGSYLSRPTARSQSLRSLIAS